MYSLIPVAKRKAACYNHLIDTDKRGDFLAADKSYRSGTAAEMGVPARRAETAPGNVRRMDEVAMNVRQDAIPPEYFIAHFYE